MARQIHKIGELYKIYSTVCDGFITRALNMRELKFVWLNDCHKNLEHSLSFIRSGKPCKCRKNEIERMRNLRDHLQGDYEYDDSHYAIGKTEQTKIERALNDFKQAFKIIKRTPDTEF